MGKFILKYIFISLQASTHYNSKHKFNFHINPNGEYLCRGIFYIQNKITNLITTPMIKITDKNFIKK